LSQINSAHELRSIVLQIMEDRMSTTGLDVFDTTLQETNRWLRIVMEELQTDNRRMAFAALRAVLHALRDRIGSVNAAHLGAQLPMLLRGAYYEGWRPGAKPARERRLERFLARIAADLKDKWSLNPEEAARAAFVALTEQLDRREVLKVMDLLPLELRQLWPANAGAIAAAE
jgi:uncharacterized protein (DUF2267 family)